MRTPPVVAGLARSGLEARLRGRVLLEQLGCVACHADASGELGAQAGPELAGLERRIRADYVPRFLADPAGVEPGTTMPDLLSELDSAERAEAVAALAQYLGSFVEATQALAEPQRAAPARGHELFHTIGCVACHAPRSEDGVELPLPGSAPLGELSAKYSLPGLRAFLLDPLATRPAGRMPDLQLEPGEAQDLAALLLGSTQPASPAPELPNPAKIAAGRTLFAERGCAQCHRLADPLRAPSQGSKPLAELDVERGCLSGKSGPWPLYSLAPEQRAELQLALRTLDQPLTDEQRIRTQLAAKNCIACHARGDFGGIAPERNEFFSGDPSLGQDGRLPPPLGGVGAKLQPAWLADSIAHGQSVRSYLRTRMPGFGLAVARALAAPLARTDTLPPLEFGLAALPDGDEARESTLELGRALTGDRGLGCVACHAFAGERGTTMNGIDLVDSTGQRLRREWFEHFLRAPFRLRADTLMPEFFEG
ncbi:MAG: c-type cytochrome, partial [Planctomycetota bacterium]